MTDRTDLATRRATASSTPTVYAAPPVIAYARKLGIDLSGVRGSGTRGRILPEDLERFVRSALAASPRVPVAAQQSPTPTPEIDFAKFGPVEKRPLSRIRRISGPALTRNWQTIPHVTNFDVADVTDLEAFRRSLNAQVLQGTAKITTLAFLIKASAAALKAFPDLNASLSGVDVVFKRYVHIGFAVDTPDGLVVPVIRNCDAKGVRDLAEEMSVLAGRARAGKIAATEMQGGCFSISSLGGIGGTGFTPIINAPEVAILGAARSATQAVWNGTEFKPRLMLPLCLSWDHRVIDGAMAARFLAHLCSLLSDLRRVGL